jgi:hypothetical protein
MRKEEDAILEAMNLLENLKRDKEKRQEKLDRLPSENQFIPKEEMKIILTLTRILNEYIKKIETDRAIQEETVKEGRQVLPPVPIGGIQEKVVLSNIINLLDRYDNIWQYKFSTGDLDKDGKPLSPEKDSIYYMTRSGASLRLKMTNRDKGLRKVVQPFSEFIYFMQTKDDISETPKIGYITQEFFSQEFLDLLENGQIPSDDYVSSIKKYFEDNKLTAVTAPKSALKHDGNLVNKIYFENKKII